LIIKNSYKEKIVRLLQSNSYLFKEGFWVFVGQISVVIISLVALRIITELITPDILGEATLWTGFIILLKNIFISPVSNYQLRYYSRFNAEEKLSFFNSVINRYYKNSFLISSVVLAAVILISSLTGIYRAPLILVLGLFLFYLSDVIKANYLNKLSAERKQFLFALWVTGDTLLMYSCAIAIITAEKSAPYYITGQALGVAIGVIIFFPVVKKNLTQQGEKTAEYGVDIFSEFKRYGLPFIPIAVITWILSLGNRYILSSYTTLVEVGVFTAAFSISSRPFLFLSGIIANFFRPILFQAESDKNKAGKVIKLWLILTTALSFLVFFSLFLGGPLLADLFLAENYHLNIHTLFITIGTGFLFFSIFQVFENILLSYEKSRFVLYCNIIAVIIFFVANFFLIENFGIVGAGIAVTTVYFFQLMAGIYFLNHIPLSFKLSSLFSKKSI
jgi:O-antigen/teichoic acid export membrane protein